MKKSYHPLLESQINKYIHPELMEIPDIINLLEDVDRTYLSLEEDYIQMKKLFEICMGKLNKSKIKYQKTEKK